jgi:hypothetical protein
MPNSWERVSPQRWELTDADGRLVAVVEQSLDWFLIPADGSAGTSRWPNVESAKREAEDLLP